MNSFKQNTGLSPRWGTINQPDYIDINQIIVIHIRYHAF